LMDEPSDFKAVAAGALAGLSCMVREVGLVFILIVGFCLAARTLIFRWRVGEASRVTAIALMALTAVALPYWIVIKIHTGEFALTQRHGLDLKAEVMGYENGSRERPMDHAEDGAALVDFNPLAALLKTGRLSYEYFREAVLATPWPFWIMALVGLAMVKDLKRETLSIELVVPVSAIAIALAYAAFTPHLVDRRALAPVAALACVFAGRGAAGLPPRVRGLLKGRAARAVFAALALASAAGVVYVMHQGSLRAALLRDYYSEESHRFFEVAGHREACEKALEDLSIEPGMKVCAPAPSFAYYLGGNYVELAETVDGVKYQVAMGACEWVAVGEVSVRRNRPSLRELVAGLDPLPDAGLVFRYYLTDYGKLTSIYRLGADPIEVDAFSPAPDLVDKLLVFGAQYEKEGKVEQARQTFELILEPDPENMLAHRELIKVYLIYGATDRKFLDRADDHLMRFSFMAPEDANLKQYRRVITNLRSKYEFTWGGSGE